MRLLVRSAMALYFFAEKPQNECKISDSDLRSPIGGNKEDIMFCGECGTKLEEGMRFCPECGTPVKMPDFSQAAAEKPQELP
ncbi:MAG: zinc ribbon domain-containing protein, partial [Clostridium sp.]|nr:zinc ribbon domain-containing protein [Clostridium sp.]